MKTVLNPLVRLRRDERRVLIYKVDPVLHLVDKHGFIPPLSAILLSLFDGTRDRDQALSDFAYLVGPDDLELERRTAESVSVTGVQEKRPGQAAASGKTSSRGEDGGLSPLRTADRIANAILDKVSEVFGDDTLMPLDGSEPRRDLDPFKFVMEARDVNIAPGDGRLAAPIELNYLVTHACPRRCIYCYAETTEAPRARLLSMERFRELAAEAGELGINAMYLSGGDPFARKEILEIISTLIEFGVPPFVSTKSHLSRSVCEKLRDLGLDRIQVSLDALEEPLADELTGSPGYYREITETLDNLAAVGIPVRLKAVVTSRNIHDLPALLETMVGRGITAFQLAGYGRSVFRHDDELFPSNDQLAKLMEETDRFLERHPGVNLLRSNVQPRPEMTPKLKKYAWDNRSSCSAGRTAMTILPDGRVTICDELPTIPAFLLGDVTRQSLMEVWNSAEVGRFLRPNREDLAGTICEDCPDFEECHFLKSRCLRDVYNVHRDANHPDPKCPRAGVSVRF